MAASVDRAREYNDYPKLAVVRRKGVQHRTNEKSVGEGYVDPSGFRLPGRSALVRLARVGRTR